MTALAPSQWWSGDAILCGCADGWWLVADGAVAQTGGRFVRAVDAGVDGSVAVPLRGRWPGFLLDAAAQPTPASTATSKVACTVGMRDCLIDVFVLPLRVAQSSYHVLPEAGEPGWMCPTALRQIRSVGRSAQRLNGGRPRGRKDSRGAERAAGRIPPTTDPSSRALPQVAHRVIRRN